MSDTPAWAEAPSAVPADANATSDVQAQELKAAQKAQKEQEAAQKKLEREEKKAAKDAEKAALAEEKEAKKAAKLQEKADKQAQKDAAIQARNEAKAAKAAQREQGKQPEQNGVRRPRPDGECGKAWALFDQLSQSKGAPVAAAEIRAELAKGTELNEGNVRAEYPRWKKFHGLSGTIQPAAPLAPPAEAQPQPAA